MSATARATLVGLLAIALWAVLALLTVVTGADATAEATDQITAWVAENRPALSVEIHRGGQPLYPYLFGVE